MKAIIAREFGGPEVLQYQDTDDPQPGPGEVVIEMNPSPLRVWSWISSPQKPSSIRSTYSPMRRL